MKLSYNFFFNFLFLLFLSTFSFTDNFVNNFYNNHGSVGLINIPTARFFDEEVHGVTLYDGTPDQKITLTSNPYNWFEASFFYTNIQGKPYPGFEYQDYKDKGFNIKLRLKKEGYLPAIAIGLNDFSGTGFYSSEYIVSSYGIGNVDFHFGIGWGQLNGDPKLKNPLSYLSDRFNNRPGGYNDFGGTFNPDQYFSGPRASNFYGISFKYNNNLFLNFEKDPTKIDGPRMPYPDKENQYSYGLNYKINNNFNIGLSHERGSYFSLRFNYKNNPKVSRKKYEYKAAETNVNDNSYTKLIKNLEENGLGVNKITETSRSLGLELTQFIHSDIALVEQIIKEAGRESGINKNIIKDIKIADLDAVNEIDESFERRSKTIYEREAKKTLNTNTGLRFQPFLASREEFFKGALLIENNSEIILKENLFFNINLKYSIANNFDDLRFPPVDTFPAQVRSDIKQYLKNMDKGILIGRAQLDYHYSHNKHNHFMLTGGILEDMFSGYGFEYLYFKPNTNYSIGFEVFNVQKRDYDWGFGYLDYKNTTYSANFYYRNYGSIPFDMKLSVGEYIAGDKGSTIEFSRRFKSGVNFGVFASFTDVSTEDFGEGSFDKGIFFNIPIYGNFINYTWRPLTKDPAAKLNRRNSLHDLLVRFRPLD
ncbi:YjbH domain-containing protein [Gammaproteobacteria bacterium]|nr:YjbH domain-containing protein [Gammaproteobacteria bacterium]